jgi:proteic killer suppression protein
MIRSFKHRGLKRFYERDDRSGIRPDLVDTVQEVLTVLDDAATPQELALPGYRLHPLKSDLKRVLVRYGAGKLAHHFPLSGRRCF